MADTALAPETPAAESAAVETAAPAAVVTETAKPDAAKPKAEAAAEPVKMTPERAREILRGNKDVIPDKQERDPLTEEEFDPLTDLDADGKRVVAEVEEEAESGQKPEAIEEAAAVETEEEKAAREKTEGEAEAAKTAEADAAKGGGSGRMNMNTAGEDGVPLISDRTRAILRMVRDEHISEAEAAQRLFGGLVAEKPAEAANVEAVKEPTVEELTGQIAEAEGEYEKALESFVNADIIKANRKVQDLREQRVEAKLKAREEAQRAQARTETAAQTFERETAESMGDAEKVFPTLMADGSKERAALQKAINEAFASGDPVTKSSKWPKRIAAEVALSLGITPAPAEAAAVKGGAKPAEAAAPAKPASKVAPAAPVKRTVPLLSPGGVGGASPSPAQTLSQRIQAAKAANDVKGLQLLMREATALSTAA